MNLTLDNFEEIIRDIKLDIDYNLKRSITNAIEKVERFEIDPLMNASTLLFDFSKEGSNESISQISRFLHRINFLIKTIFVLIVKAYTFINVSLSKNIYN